MNAKARALAVLTGLRDLRGRYVLGQAKYADLGEFIDQHHNEIEEALEAVTSSSDERVPLGTISQCPSCDGDGKLTTTPGQLVQCWRCSGSGRVMAYCETEEQFKARMGVVERFKSALAASEPALKAKLKPFEDGEAASRGVRPADERSPPQGKDWNSALPEAEGLRAVVKATERMLTPPEARPEETRSPTPRTEEWERSYSFTLRPGNPYANAYHDLLDFARQLERELAEKNTCCDAREEQYGCFRAVRAERELREARSATTRVVSESTAKEIMDALQDGIESKGPNSLAGIAMESWMREAAPLAAPSSGAQHEAKS